MQIACIFLCEIIFFVVAYYFGVSEIKASVFISSVFVILPLVRWENGVYLLFLNAPFFLGDSKRDYFYIYEIIVISTLLGFLRCHARELWCRIRSLKGEIVSSPKKIHLIYGLLIGFMMTAVLSFPFDLRETLAELKNAPFLKSVQRFFYGHEGKEIYWLRMLWNYFSAIFLFFMIRFKWKANTEKMLVYCLGATFLIQLIFGFLFLWWPAICPRTNVLFLSLMGWQPIGYGKSAFVGFAKNCGYFAQYVVYFWPLLLICLRSGFNKTLRLLCVVIIAAAMISIPFTFQRTPVLIIMFQGFILFGILFFKRRLFDREDKEKRILKPHPLTLLGIVFVGIFPLMFAGIDNLWWGGRGIGRLLTIMSNPSLRDQIWAVAWEMFKFEPFLGIGTGQFHEYFSLFCEKAGIEFAGQLKVVRTTAHNVYFHILAENGLTGMAFFMAAIGVTLVAYVKSISHDTALIDLKTVLFLSWCGFLLYGISQHVFYIRSMQVIFFMVWAMLVNVISMSRNGVSTLSFFKTGVWVRVGLIWLVLGFAFHCYRTLQI